MAMRFKVGDKVRIKSFSEIRLTPDSRDPESNVYFSRHMKTLCGTGKTYTVSIVGSITYDLNGVGWAWADAWLEPAEEEQKILPGYAVKRYYEDGTSRVYLASIVKNRLHDKPRTCIVSDSGSWDYADEKKDVLYETMTKVEVYGYAQYGPDAVSFSTEDRPLLWTWEHDKPAPKKMTVAEIRKELGYDVEIVKDGGSDA